MTDPGRLKNSRRKPELTRWRWQLAMPMDFFKERKEPDYARLDMINKNLNIPLVLHGASDWENGRVVEVVKRGIACFNVDTAIRLAFTNNLVRTMKDQDNVSFDIRKLLGGARRSSKRGSQRKNQNFRQRWKSLIHITHNA